MTIGSIEDRNPLKVILILLSIISGIAGVIFLSSWLSDHFDLPGNEATNPDSLLDFTGLEVDSLTKHPDSLDITTYPSGLPNLDEFELPRDKAHLLGWIGSTYYEQGVYDSALYYHQKALRIYRGISDERGEASQLRGMGKVYFYKNKLGKALDCLDSAYFIDKRCGFKKEKADDLQQLGLVLLKFYQEPEHALLHFKEAWDIHKNVEGCRRSEAEDLMHIARAYERYDQIDSLSIALTYLGAARGICEKEGFKELYARVEMHIQRITQTVKRMRSPS